MTCPSGPGAQTRGRCTPIQGGKAARPDADQQGPAKDIRIFLGRPVQGVRLMRLDDGEHIVDIERVEDAEDDDDTEGAEE